MISAHFSIHDKRPQEVKDEERRVFFAAISRQIENKERKKLNRTLFAYGSPTPTKEQKDG